MNLITSNQLIKLRNIGIIPKNPMIYCSIRSTDKPNKSVKW